MSLSVYIALFGAGVASFLAPCVVPLIPAYIGMITGSATAAAPGKMVSATLVFIAGFASVFAAFGMLAGLAGARAVHRTDLPQFEMGTPSRPVGQARCRRRHRLDRCPDRRRVGAGGGDPARVPTRARMDPPEGCAGLYDGGTSEVGAMVAQGSGPDHVDLPERERSLAWHSFPSRQCTERGRGTTGTAIHRIGAFRPARTGFCGDPILSVPG